MRYVQDVTVTETRLLLRPIVTVSWHRARRLVLDCLGVKLSPTPGQSRSSLGVRDCLPPNLPLRNINLARHTYSLLEPLSQSLPNLEHLTICNFERSESYLDGIDSLPLLHTFSSLSSLSLQDVEMDQFYNYFQQGGGQNLKSLRYCPLLHVAEAGKTIFPVISAGTVQLIWQSWTHFAQTCESWP